VQSRHTESAVDSAFDFSWATLLTIGLAAVVIASFAGHLASADGSATLEAIFNSGREAELDPAIEAS
jgi:hypothetical protein